MEPSKRYSSISLLFILKLYSEVFFFFSFDRPRVPSMSFQFVNYSPTLPTYISKNFSLL